MAAFYVALPSMWLSRSKQICLWKFTKWWAWAELQAGRRCAVGGGAGGLAALRRVAGRRGAADGAAVGVRVSGARCRGECPHSACFVPLSRKLARRPPAIDVALRLTEPATLSC
jgi:hypothetical protein